MCHACTRPAFATGLCQRHYNQARRKRMSTCTVEQCTRPQHASELCMAHYKRQWSQGDLDVTRPIGWRPPAKPKPGPILGPPKPKTCSVATCDRLHYARRYCKQHYRRFQKYGNPVAMIDFGEKHDWTAEKTAVTTRPSEGVGFRRVTVAESQPITFSPPPRRPWATLGRWGTTTATAKPVPSCSLTGRCAFGVVALWRPKPTTSRRWRRSRLASGSGSTFRAARRATLPVAAGCELSAKSRSL